MKGNEGVGNKLIIIMKLISTGFKVYSPPFPFHLQLLPKDKKEESDAAVVQTHLSLASEVMVAAAG